MSINKEIKLGGYTLTDMPGSASDIVISHGAYIAPEFQGKGYGQKFHKERILSARAANKSYMLCVVNDNNFSQKHIVEKFGWKLLDSFISECTCHRLNLYGRSPYSTTGMEE